MINTFLHPTYYFTYLLFIFAAFAAFYIPGSVLLRRFKFDLLTNLVFSFSLGITVWAFQGFIFGFLGFRNLSYIYLLIFFALWIRNGFIRGRPALPRFNLTKKDLPVIIILAIGVFVQLLFNFLSGVNINEGLYFCCGLPDSLYHIALTNSVVNNFPPHEPAMAGVLVYNYHYLSNLVNADLVRVFHLPLTQTIYQYVAPLVSILIGLSAIVFSRILKLGRVYTCFLLLFLFFVGDSTFILSFLAGNGLNFNTPFLYDATNLWYSPPRAFASLITLSGLGMFCIWIKNKSTYLGVLLSAVIASLVGFKIYSGFSIFFGLGFVTLYLLWKKDYKKIYLPILTLLIALCLYLPINKGASGLSYIGFWRVENFISQPGLGISHLELARQIYADHHNFPRIIEYELIYSVLYFIFIFGLLNLGWIQNKKSLKLFPKELNIFLIPSVVISLLLGFLSFQKISGANTSQFLITAEMIASLYVALACSFIYRKLGRYKIIFVIAVIALTIPRVLNSSVAKYRETINYRGLIISNQELDALNYLKNKTPTSSLVFSDNLKIRDEKTCYYIGFLSNRKMFLCDAEGIVQDHGVDISSRNKVYKEISKSYYSHVAIDRLISSKIDYIYTNSSPAIFNQDTGDLKTVFKNDKIRIIKVNR